MEAAYVFIFIYEAPARRLICDTAPFVGHNRVTLLLWQHRNIVTHVVGEEFEYYLAVRRRFGWWRVTARAYIEVSLFLLRLNDLPKEHDNLTITADKIRIPTDDTPPT